jgi:hypothetical protein
MHSTPPRPGRARAAALLTVPIAFAVGAVVASPFGALGSAGRLERRTRPPARTPHDQWQERRDQWQERMAPPRQKRMSRSTAWSCGLVDSARTFHVDGGCPDVGPTATIGSGIVEPGARG